MNKLAKKEEKQKAVVVDSIVPTDISNELEQSYLSYAMSVIVGRAIPDVRDGLKPVQRRIIYGMYENGNTNNKPFVKCARIVGNVMGNYHPHGDASIYDALVRMAQPFSMLVPLIEPQGNFGSIDGDNPAAMRYTEARLAAITDKMTEDLIKDVTVDFIDNFDGSLKEPSFLPARLPNLLINGANGIAVGMSTNIMPHNLTEVMNAVIEAINVGDNFTYEDIAKHIKGPDFPTGGIISGEDGIKKYMKTGIGKVIIRAKYHIEQEKSRQAIIIDEIPYTVNKANLIEKVADLASAGKLIGISELRDETDKNGIRIYIGLKKDVNPDLIISYLYKNTQMEITKNIQNLALTHNGLKPEILSIRDLIANFIQMREIIIKKRTEYELKQKEKRLHIVEGRKIAINNIDTVIKTIKNSTDPKDAKTKLMNSFNLSEIQAEDILEMKLSSFTKMRIDQLIAEEKQLQQEIANLKKILADRKEILSIIKQESLEIIQKFGQPRKSQIDFSKKQIDHDTLVAQIQKADSQILISQSWRVKRYDLDDYTEKIIKDDPNRDLTDLFDEPIKINQEVTSDHSILIFTKFGTVFNINPSTIPLQTNYRAKKDTNISEYIKLEENDQIADIVIIENEIFDEERPAGHLPKYFLFVTEKGLIKKTDVSEFKKIRSNGLKAIDLKEGDSMSYVRVCDDCTEITLKSTGGKSAACDLETIKISSRTAKGQKFIKMGEDDTIESIEIKQLIKQINIDAIPVAKTEEPKEQGVQEPEKESTISDVIPTTISQSAAPSEMALNEDELDLEEEPHVKAERHQKEKSLEKKREELPPQASTSKVESKHISSEEPIKSIDNNTTHQEKKGTEQPEQKSQASILQDEQLAEKNKLFLESLKLKPKSAETQAKETTAQKQDSLELVKEEPKTKPKQKESKDMTKKTTTAEKKTAKSSSDSKQMTLDLTTGKVEKAVLPQKKTTSQTEPKKPIETKPTAVATKSTSGVTKPQSLVKPEKPSKIEKPQVEDPMSDDKIIAVLTETPATFMEIGKLLKLSNLAQYPTLKLKLTTLAIKKKIDEVIESGDKKYKRKK